MSQRANHIDRELTHLHQRARLLIAFEEAAIGVLMDELNRSHGELPSASEEMLRRQMRSHLVGIIKHRAVMGALGIDV